MKTLPAVLVREKNKLFTPDPWLVLLEIVLSDTATLRFCSNNEDIVFSGKTWSAFPFFLEPAKQSGKGDIPTISLKVCNVTQLIQGYLEELDGGVGSEVTVIVVNSGHLDEDYTELEMAFSVLSTECDAEWATFKLGSPSPLRRRYPPNRFISLHCNWEFKGLECGFSGSAAECDRTFKRCEELANTARFGGYPGLNLRGWRIV